MLDNYFIHNSAVVDEGAKIGAGTHVWHNSHIMTNSSVGINCSIGQNVFVARNVNIGNNCKIQNDISVYEGVEISNDVFLGPSMTFTNVINPRSAVNRKDEYKMTKIKEGATIGANATILCGITLGKHCFVGAGAVVTNDVLDYQLIVGNPAKSIGWMSEKGVRLSFNAKGIATCTLSKEQYGFSNNKLVKFNSK